MKYLFKLTVSIPQHTALGAYPGLVKDLVDSMGPVKANWVMAGGFGSLLDLKITKIDRHFLTWLEGRWDWKKKTLRIRDDFEIVIDEDMIMWITGLPAGEQDFTTLKPNDPELIELEKEYGKKKGIEYINVYNKALLEINSRNIFLRHFILLSFRSLFCMTKYNFITPRLLHLLKDEHLNDPYAWNWCGFLSEWLAGQGRERGKPSALILLVSFISNSYTVTALSEFTLIF